MKYNFKSRKELIHKINSIPTPHSHKIQLDGNSAIIEWKGKAPDGWSEYKAKSKKVKKDD